MEILLVALGIGFLCMIAIIIFAVASKSKESTVYVPVSNGKKTKNGSIKKCDIEGFLN